MNYAQKLDRLRDRRQGFYTKDGTYLVAKAIAEGKRQEKFASLAQPEAVKYALGAMQAVDSQYTAKCYDEGRRVGDRLIEGLEAERIRAEYDFQGSVPLDVHVRGNSDVDLLLLHLGFFTFESAAASRYRLYPDHHASPVAELMTLRENAVEILKRRYWAATVDASGSKSVKISGGSLQRIVDVVPSHWHNTLLWSSTNDKRHREIHVLDCHKMTRVHNRPFMHIGLITDRCVACAGALRKVIRLLKNLRYDASPAIDLSSYDIAALAWHMTDAALMVGPNQDLLLAWSALEHLLRICSNSAYRDSLIVPDKSRKVFDAPGKLTAAARLLTELAELVVAVAEALQPWKGLRRDALSAPIAY